MGDVAVRSPAALDARAGFKAVRDLVEHFPQVRPSDHAPRIRAFIIDLPDASVGVARTVVDREVLTGIGDCDGNPELVCIRRIPRPFRTFGIQPVIRKFAAEIVKSLPEMLRSTLHAISLDRGVPERPEGTPWQSTVVNPEPLHKVGMKRIREGVLEGLDGLFGSRRVQLGESTGALVLPKPGLDALPGTYEVVHQRILTHSWKPQEGCFSDGLGEVAVPAGDFLAVPLARDSGVAFRERLGRGEGVEAVQALALMERRHGARVALPCVGEGGVVVRVDAGQLMVGVGEVGGEGVGLLGSEGVRLSRCGAARKKAARTWPARSSHPRAGAVPYAFGPQVRTVSVSVSMRVCSAGCECRKVPVRVRKA